MIKNKLALAVAIVGALGMTGAQGAETATAIFAGGCFWSIESDFDHAPGVISTTSGYIGGHVDNPSYEQVVTETTGHREAVKIVYDPTVTSYDKLVDTFFHLIDPIETRGQFCDYGESYTTAIYAGTDAELKVAEAGKEATAAALGKPVATIVAMAPTFWPAEDYHQDFWKGSEMLQNGLTRAQHYARYRVGCGKNGQVEAIWGKDAFKGLDGHA
ncbi:peptide-methionine (S)-S-oxide reductase [Devosia insulae DS-56]|uniref:Peptide methionine sulfoxide reductase MsrA n=1 Tax=Devosia insulae DS-56 TaxID=1116389 RepID=A0A1E5XP53_9HYPH|nr:peptide-methionine (S)-S-oxide reductase MsrA [Devosia insulae]OEO30294.1 peptide-methionine (S)-S-oxide reductase [Devosia insulae DS-56]